MNCSRVNKEKKKIQRQLNTAHDSEQDHSAIKDVIGTTGKT